VKEILTRRFNMSSQDISPSELYAIELTNNEPGYYSQIPAILHHLTYVKKEKKKSRKDVGKVVRRKLSPYAISLYLLLKQVAGSKNAAIWMKGENLAEMMGVSPSKFAEAKDELAMEMEQLNGKALIKIEKSKKTTTRKNGQKGSIKYDKIIINHIWPENNAYMATRKFQPSLAIGIVDNSYANPLGGNANYGLPLGGNTIPETTPLSGNAYQAESQRANNNPSYQEPICKIAEPAACCGQSCHLNSKESVNLSVQALAEKTKIENSMKKFGCDDNFIKEMLRKYPISRIFDAGYYTEMQIKRGIVKKENGSKYLRTAITKGLKWQKRAR